MEDDDLFYVYDSLPIEIKNVLDKFSEMDNTYEDCENLVLALNEVGYTCDYGLDGIPHTLKKIEP